MGGFRALVRQIGLMMLPLVMLWLQPAPVHAQSAPDCDLITDPNNVAGSGGSRMFSLTGLPGGTCAAQETIPLLFVQNLNSGNPFFELGNFIDGDGLIVLAVGNGVTNVSAPGFTLRNNRYELNAGVAGAINTTVTMQVQNFTVSFPVGKAAGLATINPFDVTATTDSAAPVVQSIAPTGAPAATASSATFRVTFDENATNISTDDFALTATGSATGTIASVSASSGTTVDVVVNNIVGAGSLRLDLRGSTNIADGQGNAGPSAFTAGTAHTVNRPRVGLSISATNVNEGGTAAQRTVTITATAESAVTGDAFVVLTQSGTARSSGVARDFDLSNQTITIPNGSTTGSVTVTVLNDNFDEPDTENRSFQLGTTTSNVVQLASAVPSIGAVSVTLVIQDDDPLPVITIETGSADEGDGVFSFILRLDRPSSKPITATVATSNGTATAGSDYTANSDTISFFTLSTSVAFPVFITEDSAVEPDETFNLTVSSVSNATLSGGGSTLSAVGTIEDNDGPPEITANLSRTSIIESDSGALSVFLQFGLERPAASDVTVNYQTMNGTATAGADFTAAMGTATITAGQTASGVVTISVLGDRVVEASETFSLVYSGVQNADDSNLTNQTITINDNDRTFITVSSPTVAEGAGSATVNVTSSAAVQGGFTLLASTVDGIANLADGDYTQVNGQTLTFAGDAGEVETLSITINDDDRVETTQAFTVRTVFGTSAAPASSFNTADRGAVTIQNDDFATVSFQDVTVNENAGTATITAQLDKKVDAGFSLRFGTADGTATTSDSDYASGTSNVTFTGNANETKSFTVTLGGDSKVEADETISVSMSNFSAVVVPASTVNISDTGTITLRNDDTAVLTIADQNGLEDGGAITMSVQLSAEVQGGFTVNVSTSDGTATTANNDYSAITNQTLTFAGTAGEVETFSLRPTSDSVFEQNETVTVSMSSVTPSGTGVSSGSFTTSDTATVTFLNDDNNLFSVNDVAVVEGDAGSQNMVFTISLLGPATGDGASVRYAITDGTAVLGQDYSTPSGLPVVVVGGGSSSTTVTVPITSDRVVERDETLTITLSNPGGTNVGIGDATGTGTITNDDTANVTIANVTRDESAGTATITLTLDAVVDAGLDVDVSTADGTATTADGDYTAVSGSTVSFFGNINETQTLTVTLANDAKVEGNETVNLSMSSLSPAKVSASDIDITDTGTLTIRNDDTATLSIANVNGNEDDGAITLVATLNAEVDGGFTVNASTSDGSATLANSDYSQITGQQLTFVGNANETQNLTLLPTSDSVAEPDETVRVSLGGLNAPRVAANAVTHSGIATVTILNDDSAPTLSINDVTVNEGDSGSSTATFTVTKSGATAQTVTVNYGLGGAGTASILDFGVNGGTLSFAPNETTKTFTVSITGDTIVEGDETQALVLSSPVNATISDGTGVLTITNDDQVSLSIADVTVQENGGTARVTVTSVREVQGGFSIDAATSNGTATTGDGDFTAVTGQRLQFNGTANETQSFDITIADDGKVEANETLTVALSNPMASQADAADVSSSATGTVTIRDNDIARIEVLGATVAESDGVVPFRLTLSSPVDIPITVVASVSNGTATNGEDFTGFTSRVVTINANTTSVSLDVPVINDTLDEENREGLLLSVSSLNRMDRLVTFGSSRSAVGFITDDDDRPTLSLANVAVDEDAGEAVVTVTQSAASGLDVSFTYATADGTATQPGDYTAQNNVFTRIIAGQTTAQLRVPIIDDSTEEPAETLTVSLASVFNANAPSGPATVTINASDAVVPSLVSVMRPRRIPALTRADRVNFEVIFSEDVQDVDASDFVAVGSTATATFVSRISASTYNVVLSGGDLASFNGTVGLAISPLAKIRDLANNGLTPGAPSGANETYTLDNTKPVPTLASTAGPIVGSSFSLSVTFSELVIDFALEDITVNNGTASALNTSDFQTFTFDVAPTADGPVTVDIAADIAQDRAGNTNQAAAQLTRTADLSAPSVTIAAQSAITGAINSAFTVNITFSEAVTGFELADITSSNATVANLATSDNRVFTAVVTPLATGPITVDVAAGVAQDSVGNGNSAATQFTATGDFDGPTVTLLSFDQIVTGPFSVLINSPENIFGLTESDFTVTGGSIVSGTLSGSGGGFGVQVAPVLGQTVVVTLPAGAVADSLGNVTSSASVLSVQAGSPQSEFDQDREVINGVVMGESVNRLNTELSANTGMMANMMDRFISGFSDRDGAATRDVPFDITGTADLTLGQSFATKGSFFGQTTLQNGVTRTAMGQFDISSDETESFTAQISGRLTYERSVSDDTRLGYFFGASLSKGQVKGRYEGDTAGIGAVVGGYGLKRFSENLFANAYAGLGYSHTDLSLVGPTLSLSGDYDALSYYAGAQLTGSMDIGSGIEFRPNVAVDYGQTDVGIVGLQASAFGLTSMIEQNFGTATVLEFSLTPEVILPIVGANSDLQFRVAPSYICRQTSGQNDRSECGGGLGLALDGQGADGRTRYGVGVTYQDTGTSRQTSAELFFEAQF